MRYLMLVFLVGCSLSPDRIERQVEDCLDHDGFRPIVVIGKNQTVKRVICTVDEETGITIIDRGFQLLPSPSFPFP